MTVAARQRWVDVEQGRLFVEVCGDGPPIMMLHGWALDQRMFRPQVRELSFDFQVITFDRRGFGRSQAPPDLRQELDDIDRILDALGCRQVHLLGMSQGGRLAIRYAVTRGDRLRSLLLQGAVIDGLDVDEDPSERVPVSDYAALAKSGRLDEVRRRWMQHPMMRLGAEYTAEARLIEEILGDYTGADLVNVEAASYAFDIDVLSQLEHIGVPTLVLTGTQETPARKRHAKELLARIPGAREVLFEGSGHLSNLTSAAEYNDAVRRFCSRAERLFRHQDAALLIE
jgi:pimeloyl-ACP methyl ester carboxylesterase